MDKEDCIQALLSTLRKPEWKCSTSVADWDLKNILWKAGLLLTPEQAAGLLADIRRRGLIACAERRSGERVVAMWGVRITAAGEEWLAQRASTPVVAARRSTFPVPASASAGHRQEAVDSDHQAVSAGDSATSDSVPLESPLQDTRVRSPLPSGEAATQ